MGVRFFVSFGCGVFFVDGFDQFKVPGSNLKLGFWIAQQGSIYAFIILIAVYAAVMNRLDRELLACTESDGGRDSLDRRILSTPKPILENPMNDVRIWTYLLIGLSFALYIGIAIWSWAGSTKDFMWQAEACRRLRTGWPPRPTG